MNPANPPKEEESSTFFEPVPNNNIYLCHKCTFQCETAKQLHNHVHTYDITSFICPDCGEIFIGKKKCILYY